MFSNQEIHKFHVFLILILYFLFFAYFLCDLLIFWDSAPGGWTMDCGRIGGAGSQKSGKSINHIKISKNKKNKVFESRNKEISCFLDPYIGFLVFLLIFMRFLDFLDFWDSAPGGWTMDCGRIGGPGSQKSRKSINLIKFNKESRNNVSESRNKEIP